MERRNFIQTLTTGAATGILLSPANCTFAGLTNRDISELEEHIVSDIKFTTVKLNYPRQVGKNSHLGIHGHGPEVRIGIVITDKGAQGWGMLQAGGDKLERSTKYLKGKKLTTLIDPGIGVIDDKALRKWLIDHDKAVFLADAEANPDQDLMMELYRKRIVDFHLTDTIGYGFTPWRKLMPELVAMGTSASPHAWGQLFKSYYNAHLAGALGNVPTIEGVTCFSEEVDFGDYQLKEGKLYPSSEPGFGMQLLKD